MLNPTLFRLLERRFGKGQVRVTHEGWEMIASYKLDPTRSLSTIRYSLEVEEGGEEYFVKCPFCQDWKERLYINHRWGVYDEKTNTRNIWLAHCWNEECLANVNNQKLLYEQVVESIAAGPTLGLARPERRSADQIVVPTRKIDLPGALWPLDDMKKRSPKHAAIQFAEDRLWDPVYIGKRYEVGYCVDSYLEQARNRIVAPIFLHGKLVGWQARYLGREPPEGHAKWYTCPGMKAARVLYNYDEMKHHQTKVICEGPADVWAFGPQACAVFKKSISTEQRKLLSEAMRPDDTVVILLDPDQDEKAAARNELHHIEQIYLDLEKDPKLKGRIVKVYLPGGKDPDELDREYMRALIKYEADKLGLHVSFGKPRKEVIVDASKTDVRDLAADSAGTTAGRPRLRRRSTAAR